MRVEHSGRDNIGYMPIYFRRNSLQIWLYQEKSRQYRIELNYGEAWEFFEKICAQFSLTTTYIPDTNGKIETGEGRIVKSYHITLVLRLVQDDKIARESINKQNEALPTRLGVVSRVHHSTLT